MVKHTKLATAIKLAAIGAAGAAMLAATPAIAQEAGLESIEEVIVTGSRIQRSNMESPTPITVLDSAALKNTGTTNLADLLGKIPSAVNNINPSSTTFSNSLQGIALTELRNLGTDRTLVLVNGRRFVSGVGPGSGYGVDLNAIPTATIARVEVLTGGASAVYGSDAVAGVVNIITKNDFEGVELNVQGGQASEGDRERQDFDLTMGDSWDTGNAWVSFGYANDDGLMAGDREFSRYDIAGYSFDGDNPFGAGDANTWEWLGSSFPPAGKFGNYLGDGTPFRSGLADRENSDRFNRGEYRQMIIPAERKFASSKINLDLNDDTKVFAELNYSNVETGGTIEPTPFDLVSDVWQVPKGGPGGHDIASSLLMPQALKDALLGDGYTNLNELPANNTGRRLVEFGPRGANVKRDTFRIATGMDIDINDNWSANLYYVWGKTEQVQKDNGDLNVERVRYAMDVVDDGNGNIVCADDAARFNGCVPFNPFGLGTISPEAVDYVRASGTFRATVEQTVIGASIAGETPWVLPGGAVSTAFGFEHREEKGQEVPSGFAQSGLSSSNKIAPTGGKFTINEVFGEVRIPVMDKLSFDLAARVGDYSTVGQQSTWKVGFDSPINDAIRLRGTYSTSVRAPNISDLFAGAGETFATISDVCDGTTNATTGTIADNCRSVAAIQDRIDNDGSFTLTQVEKQSTGGFIAGNPDVDAETAKSFTLGAVITPMDDLMVAVDYYNIVINDAIDTTGRGTVVERCYSKTSGFDATCGGAARRDPSTGALLEVDSAPSNENDIETAGLDIEVNYRMDLDGHGLTFGWLYNYLDKYDTTGIIDGDVDEDKGEVTLPAHRFTFNTDYTYDKFSAHWLIRYHHSVKDSNTPELGNENGGVTAGLGELNNLDAAWYHDVSADYQFTDQIQAYIGINNLLDREPEILGQITQYGDTGINTAASIYDVTGRYYYAGVRMKF